MELDPWQKDVLETSGDILLCTGRRVGKTYIMSRKAVEKLITQGKQIIVVSLTEDQAMLIIAFALNFAREKYKHLIGKGKHRPTLKTLTLIINKKPVKMISRPVGNTGDATRGFEGGTLIVDEASRMPNLFWIAAKPILLTQAGEIWMCSTPFGKKGYFWKSFESAEIKKDPKARFKVFYQNTEDVMQNRPISESWTQEQRDGALRLLAEEQEEMTTLEYGQEFKGLFMEDLKQFFPDELIRECQTEERPDAVGINKTFFLGVDIARLGEDKSTFEAIDRTDRNNLIHVESIVTKKTLTTQTTREILQLEDKYHFRQIFIDAYTLGVGVFDCLLEDDRTKRKTIAINHWSRPLDAEEKKKTKVRVIDLFNNLKSLMERKKIKLLKGDDIFNSLKSIQYDLEDEKIFGSNKHIADGLVRACWCSMDKSLNLYIF